MSDMLPLEEALARMLAGIEPLAPRMLPLLDIDGCVLAEDCIAQLTKPPFAVSALDGYALPVAPAPGATFQVVGEVPAGEMFPNTLGPKDAVRIFTGAPVPEGTSHVLIQEDALRDGDQLTVGPDASEAANIRPAGGDFRKGDVLLSKGHRLTPQDIGLAASANHAQLLVHPKPTITIMMNGNELSWPGEALGPSSMIASNGFALATLAERMGAKLASLLLLPDQQDEIESAINQCTADIMVTIGGASVGDYDLIRPALAATGFTLDFPKVALRPGKPTFFAHRDRTVALGLPGNPVSSFISALVFLAPLIKKLAGGDPSPPLSFGEATLATHLSANGPRAHFMRARYDEKGQLAPVSSQDSSLLRLLSAADALLYRPANDPQCKAGDTVQVLALPA